jgi:hypothetical protein
MLRRNLFALSGAATVAGCGAPERLASLPDAFRARRPFQDLPEDCRIVMDGRDDRMIGQMALNALRREVEYSERNKTALGPADFLAISGGGENGAYGAGLLTAWSELGTRPTFKAVTGVSTGALSAPFAFLGKDYDRNLEQVYTELKPDDVLRSRGLLTALFSDSLYDSTPLLQTIRRFVTAEFLAAIAREYTERGRLLLVATTNLDVPVAVMWNMGSIAASGNPNAAELFSRILLASASIPGAFPPVMIDIESDNQRFQEMHVDGGTTAQVVFYPPSFGGTEISQGLPPQDQATARLAARRPRRLYVIRNGVLTTQTETTQRSTMKIAGRAISSLIQSQGVGDLFRLFVVCKRDGIDYNVAWIPSSFTEKLGSPFDPVYMKKLYDVGRAEMLAGSAWSKLPPGFDPTPIRDI